MSLFASALEGVLSLVAFFEPFLGGGVILVPLFCKSAVIRKKVEPSYLNGITAFQIEIHAQRVQGARKDRLEIRIFDMYTIPSKAG